MGVNVDRERCKSLPMAGQRTARKPSACSRSLRGISVASSPAALGEGPLSDSVRVRSPRARLTGRSSPFGSRRSGVAPRPPRPFDPPGLPSPMACARTAREGGGAQRGAPTSEHRTRLGRIEAGYPIWVDRKGPARSRPARRDHRERLDPGEGRSREPRAVADRATIRAARLDRKESLDKRTGSRATREQSPAKPRISRSAAASVPGAFPALEPSTNTASVKIHARPYQR